MYLLANTGKFAYHVGRRSRRGARIMLSVSDTLDRYAGARVHFVRVNGNNGDTLIELGSRCALARSGMHLTQSPADADLLVMNGGGWISDLYPHALESLAQLA